MQLPYETRDAKGNDILKMVNIKECPILNKEIECPICKKTVSECTPLKKIVSNCFTDFASVGDYICTDCTKLFSLYFYNYIVNPNGIKLLNVRQVRDELCKKQETPFRFIITTSQKKHLFYRSQINYSNQRFAVNLETEIIYTTCERMKILFDFVESMIGLGARKSAMQVGEIPLHVVQKAGFKALEFLQCELMNSREIQIPLYCGQKSELSEEELLCIINSVLTTQNVQRQH